MSKPGTKLKEFGQSMHKVCFSAVRVVIIK